MSPAVFLAHILAFHLAVPELVTFTLKDLWPAPVDAHCIRLGPPGFPRSWAIEYDRVAWRKNPGQRMLVIAHEACHAAYDYGVEDWSRLGFSERGVRHARIEACAEKILRDCAARRLKLEIKERPRRGRYWAARVELEELMEMTE